MIVNAPLALMICMRKRIHYQRHPCYFIKELHALNVLCIPFPASQWCLLGFNVTVMFAERMSLTGVRCVWQSSIPPESMRTSFCPYLQPLCLEQPKVKGFFS